MRWSALRVGLLQAVNNIQSEGISREECQCRITAFLAGSVAFLVVAVTVGVFFATEVLAGALLTGAAAAAFFAGAAGSFFAGAAIVFLVTVVALGCLNDEGNA